ncbi:MAG: type II toxin-antitoxin system VapC family toxin [Pseudomonadota bacterium]
MIIVDTNVIAYLYLPTSYTPAAEKLLIQEPVWGAPYLWRSELRNVIALYLRKKMLSFDQAIQIQTEAELLMLEKEFEVNSSDLLSLVKDSTCSAYDCEFVALAKNLNATLVTIDNKILSEFPSTAKSIEQFLQESQPGQAGTKKV